MNEWRRIVGEWCPRYDSYEDGTMDWNTVEWKSWFMGWLPGHLLDYLTNRQMRQTLQRKGQFGDWWIVPDGYRYEVVEHPSGHSNDPLDHVSTVGIKFTHRDQITRRQSAMRAKNTL